jgi:hypothetical protein
MSILSEMKKSKQIKKRSHEASYVNGREWVWQAGKIGNGITQEH